MDVTSWYPGEGANMHICRNRYVLVAGGESLGHLSALKCSEAASLIALG
ncbi:MAG: hypothetical protein K2I52_04970 [Muribaculaceae bacterium]|nr:hypothetical protein [Muribaculaceae bacterium]